MQHTIRVIIYIFCHSNECVTISFSGACVWAESRINDISENTERLNDNGKHIKSTHTHNATLFSPSVLVSYANGKYREKNCDVLGRCCVNCRPNFVYSEMFGCAGCECKIILNSIQLNCEKERANERASDLIINSARTSSHRGRRRFLS